MGRLAMDDQRPAELESVRVCPCARCDIKVRIFSLKRPKDISIRTSYTTWLRSDPDRIKRHILNSRHWCWFHGFKGPSMTVSYFVKWIKRHVCVHCRSFSKQSLQRCPCNQRNFYCNATCQAADWAVHKNGDMHKQYKKDRKSMKESKKPLLQELVEWC